MVDVAAAALRFVLSPLSARWAATQAQGPLTVGARELRQHRPLHGAQGHPVVVQRLWPQHVRAAGLGQGTGRQRALASGGAQINALRPPKDLLADARELYPEHDWRPSRMDLRSKNDNEELMRCRASAAGPFTRPRARGCRTRPPKLKNLISPRTYRTLNFTQSPS